MRYQNLSLSFAAIGLCASLSGQAQTPAPPAAAANPLDAVPDTMPFDVPYGAPISQPGRLSAHGRGPARIDLDGIIASRGGIPLIEGGKIIGAIGCSGGTGSQDEVVCKAGAATIK